uniref:Immunoglobulin V-set domain-containing protein n=1 Tax=Naja naja TaxID=35670 RepID=A0A8C6VPD0_NAJNA
MERRLSVQLLCLYCSYETEFISSSYTYWYIQHPGQPLKLLLTEKDNEVQGFYATLHEGKRNGTFNLEKDVSQLKDSAVYFCGGKTKMLVKNITNNKQKKLKEIMGLQIVNKIKYLGIWMRAKTIMLWQDNYIKILKQIKKDLDNWNKMQISFLGRIATIKMNILPKVLYLFQTIPILTNNFFFTELDKMVMKFIWAGKRAKIKKKYLQNDRGRGGFGLLDWEIYYKATILVWIRDWVKLGNKRILTLEGHDLQTVALISVESD